MKKILVTNNSALIDNQYDIIYTDSPFVMEYCKHAKYLNEFLDMKCHSAILDIRKKGLKLNQKIIEEFFSDYANENLNIFDVNEHYTNIFINVYKLLGLINCYPDYEITIGVSTDELYNYDSPNIVDRFVNVYYWIVEISNIKNIKLICKDLKRDDLHQDHKPINSWFLRLIDLDKKVLFFNLLKKLKLYKNKNQKIYIYKNSNVIREIEPYLYDFGFSLEKMPKFNAQIKKIPKRYDERKIKDVIDNFFENNPIENTFKYTLYAVYKKIIKNYLNKEDSLDEYISKLDKNIKIIVTNTIFNFDRLIFKKKLQQNGHKVIVVLHGLTENYKRPSDLYSRKYSDIDMLLCFNKSEKKHFEEFDPKVLVHPISSVQEAKKPRFNNLKRFFVNKKLKISNKINVFYVSLSWPMNNLRTYQVRPNDEKIYNFDKKIIHLLSNVNKRVIYKNYPRRNFIDSNPINEYAKKFKNVKTIEGDFDFRYISSIGDVFIISVIGSASTITWMINLDKPIIYLYTSKSEFITEEALGVLKKILIFVDIDKHNWENDLKNIINKPYTELKSIWDNKKIYRDKYDEEWLTGKNLHSGKLGAKYIKEFILHNTKK